MDWDVILRIARERAAVLINEFLAVSREYADTKTAAGGWGRVDEIVRMTGRHSGRELTPGALFYAAEAALGIIGRHGGARRPPSHLRPDAVAAQGFARDYGNSDGFPETSDARDVVDVPLVDPGVAPARRCGRARSSRRRSAW